MKTPSSKDVKFIQSSKELVTSSQPSNSTPQSSKELVTPQSSKELVTPQSSKDSVTPQSSKELVTPQSSKDSTPQSSKELVTPQSSKDSTSQSSKEEEDFNTPKVPPSRPLQVSTMRRTAVKMLDMSRSPIVPKPQSLQVSKIPFAGRIRCKTTENTIALKGRLFVKMNQLSSSSSLFEGEYQYRIDCSSSKNHQSFKSNSSSDSTTTQKICASCGKIPDLGHARVCIHCNILHCKYCKGMFV